MIFNERHTDDDTLLLIPALYSIDINKLSVFVIEEKKQSRDIFEEAGFWLTYKRWRNVNKCATRIEGYTPHNFAYIRGKPFAASRVL